MHISNKPELILGPFPKSEPVAFTIQEVFFASNRVSLTDAEMLEDGLLQLCASCRSSLQLHRISYVYPAGPQPEMYLA